MPLIQTQDLTPGSLASSETLQTYCGLDTMVTLEVFEELSTLFNQESETYTYERALQGPILEIMLRGFLVDETERRAGIFRLREKLSRIDSTLQTFAKAVWGQPLNPRSHKQLKEFFYGAMRLQEIWISEKGQRKLSFKREVLEKLDLYFHARPIVACILGYREVAKQLEVLETEVDPDGRMRTSYNIAGTETWRFSSSSSATGTGTNLQNITADLRRIFISDQGWKLCVIDLEQAESREVGWLLGTLFNDWTYLDACEAGDLHTTTAKLIWKNLGWTGRPGEDRAIAEKPFYRHFSYRDMSKRGGHGTTYYGTPWTMARHLKIPVKLMEDFQVAFFGAYPAIPRWHQWVARQIQTLQYLITPFGQQRHFFGRPGDDATLREGIAFSPQSSTAVRTNLGLYRHWDHFGTRTQLLAQTHDSVTFQYREEDEEWIVPKALELTQIELRHGTRVFSVPGEAKIGWNWGNHHNSKKPIGPGNELNPNGLIKWKGSKDTRKRLEGLDRILS